MRIGDWSSDVCSSDLRDIGYKLDLSPKVVSDPPNKEKTGRHSRGYPPASLLRADRREREPVEGLPPALRRAAGAQPATREAGGPGRQAAAAPLVQGRLADGKRSRALSSRPFHAAPARAGAVDRPRGVRRGAGQDRKRTRL